MKKIFATGLFALTALATAALPARAEYYNFTEQLIWASAPVHKGEALVHACTRKYRTRVYSVRRTRKGRALCWIHYSYMYTPGEKRQNFNN